MRSVLRSHVHVVVGAGGGQQLRGHLLPFERDVRVQRVAGGHAHRQAEQLAHEMVLQVGEDHLEVVEMRLRADEAGDVVDHERVVAPREAVAERLGRRHVDAVVLAVGELAALAGLEVHELLGARRCSGPRSAIVR